VALGRLKARRGLTPAALIEYQQSLALAPTAAAWVGIGRLREAQEDWHAALAAYQAALAADVGDTAARATAFDRSALVWLRLGDPGRALAASEQALAAAPGRSSIQRHHAQVLAAAGRSTPSPNPTVSPSGSGESDLTADP
jgi:tetratricopeptide (TPR) repeat protein